MRPIESSVWVYSHASDAAGDEFLRIWGASGSATPPDPGASEDYSFGYLKINVAKLPDTPLKSAKLVLFQLAPFQISQKTAKDNPLEVRALLGTFDAKKWEFSQSANCAPAPDGTIFGTSQDIVNPTDKTVKSIEIDIDLLAGPGDFKKQLLASISSKNHSLFLALTSKIDVSAMQSDPTKGGFYKIYSAAAPAKFRPELVLQY